VTPFRRNRLLAAVLALGTLLAAFTLPVSGAVGATLSRGASLAHPFSDPVWWPLSTETKMDCYSGNPGCTAPLYHATWLMDPVSTNVSVVGRTAHEPVFAMGAGIVHWGVTRDQGCGGTHGRGNFIWIDHGNGVVSWYGHLYWPFKVRDGQYVTARTQIAEIGNSGYGNCRRYPSMHYIDIAVKRGSTNGQNDGKYAEFTHLYACVNGVRQTWPQQLPTNNGNWQKWNDLPKSNRPADTIIAASDGDRSCIPATPTTPDRTTSVRMTAAGHAILRATWTRPITGPAPTSTVVLLQEYHPSIRKWLDRRKHTLSAGATGTAFTALHLKHQFRVIVSFHNSAGISAGSPPVVAIAR
jgi:hypothetical protein